MKQSLLLLALIVFLPSAFADWKFDFSRRSNQVRSDDMQQAAEAPTEKEKPGFLDFLFNSGEPLQEIVVLNTDKGFVPSTLRIRQGLNYKINVVNVNERSKNVSFVLDAFSEHHATYYGKIKSFYIKPAKDGIFSFICPETSAKGKLVVYPDSNSTEIRYPASEQ